MKDPKNILSEALKKAGSIENLLERAVKAENEEERNLIRSITNGQDHPSHEILYDYVLGQLDNDVAEKVMDHLDFCDNCADEVLKIQAVEHSLREHTLEWADRKSLLDRLKGLVSTLTFPAFVQFPATEAIRSSEGNQKLRVCRIGEPLFLTVDPPADGHIVVFRYCAATDAVDLFFPYHSANDTSVTVSTDVPPAPITKKAEGPIGMQSLTIIWTREQLFDPNRFDPKDQNELEIALQDFFTAFVKLEEREWRAAVCEYVVTEG